MKQTIENMKINILLPYKEKFDKNKASSVSITVKNNLSYSKYIDDIRIFGQNVETPLFKDNFIGLKYSTLSLKSKNSFIAHKMLELISKDPQKKQLIEIHNRPYLVDMIAKNNKFPISLFLHNDPQTMRGSKSVNDRKNILKKCTVVFCVSEYIKKLFLDGISANKEKVKVLYNGVDTKLREFPKKKKEIIYVGRLVPEKGTHLYVEAMKLIASNCIDWSFGLIGSFRLGDNKNTNVYANQIINQFNSIGSQAKFYGFQDHKFVQEKMKTASIIVIPSVWQEPFGLVAAEAMSNGLCIIASKVGGIPEIINDNGVLIEKIDKNKLYKNLIELISNDKKRVIYQKKAWKNFTFSSKESSKKLDQFRKIISENYC